MRFPIGMISEDKPIGEINWVDPGNNSDKKEIQMYRDLVAVTCRGIGQCDSGDAVDKDPYNPYGIIKRFTVNGDGHVRYVDLRGYMMKPLQRLMMDTDPYVVETPDTDSQANQSFQFNSLLPCTIYKDSHKFVEIEIEFGAETDLDDGANFNVDNFHVELVAHYGQIDREYKIVYQRESGTGPQLRIPTLGVLQSLIVVDEAESDGTNRHIRLTHEGTDLLDEEWWNLKAKSQLLDRQGTPMVGVLLTTFPPIYPMNNTFLQLEDDDSIDWGVVQIYVKSLAYRGARRTSPQAAVPRIPTDRLAAVRRMDIDVQRDLFNGTLYSDPKKNPFIIGGESI